MSKVDSLKKAISELETWGFADGIVDPIRDELRKAQIRETKVEAFYNVVQRGLDADPWETLAPCDKSHYESELERFETFFDEWNNSLLLKVGETPDKTKRYKDRDGDIFYWNESRKAWHYTKPSGRDYGWMGNAEFPGGGYGNLFPMEVVS